MILTIEKKLINLQGHPYIKPKFGERWPRNGRERLASFCPPTKFPALPHGH